VRELLKGVVDLHVHAGPSIAHRNVDAAEMMREAEFLGYRAFVIKDHCFPTEMSAQLMEKHFSKGITKPLGAMVINRFMGGFALNGIATAVEMGTRMIYLPTTTAKNHIIGVQKPGAIPFKAVGKNNIPIEPMVVLDDKGELLPEVVATLEYLATQPQVCLATGHLSAEEVDAVVDKAVDLGMKKLVITHPYYLVDATMDQMKKWAKQGAYIELNACLSLPHSQHYSLDRQGTLDILEQIGCEHIVIDSDLGFGENYFPTEGMIMFFDMLLKDLKVTEEQLNLMSKKTPAMLMGLDD